MYKGAKYILYHAVMSTNTLGTLATEQYGIEAKSSPILLSLPEN